MKIIFTGILLMIVKKSSSMDNDLDIMNVLLKTAKSGTENLEKFKNALVVIGNESCDLDSAISSLVYSLLLYQSKTPDSIVIPVLNVPRAQLPVKTEVTYVLNKYGINLDDVICRDEVDLEMLQARGSLQLTLVDHHALQESDSGLDKSVVRVIDHRPQDHAWLWPHADFTLRTVGSCCTLVAEKLLAQAPELVTPSVAELLLGTILLDTACLSPNAERAKEEDHQMADRLQALCARPVDRKLLCKELQTAKNDISALSTAQLLVKDLKIAGGIPIAGLPMRVKKFLKRNDVTSAVQQFCEERNSDLCVVYGSEKNKGVLVRDLAVFASTNSEAATQLVAALTGHKEPSLDLQPLPCSVEGFRLFQQMNIKATRKQMLPIVRQFGEQRWA